MKRFNLVHIFVWIVSIAVGALLGLEAMARSGVALGIGAWLGGTIISYSVCFIVVLMVGWVFEIMYGVPRCRRCARKRYVGILPSEGGSKWSCVCGAAYLLRDGAFREVDEKENTLQYKKRWKSVLWVADN